MQIKSGDEMKLWQSLFWNMQLDPSEETIGDCEQCWAVTAAASRALSSSASLSLPTFTEGVDLRD